MGNSQAKENDIFTNIYGFHKMTFYQNESYVSKNYLLSSHEQKQSFENLLKLYKSIQIPTLLPIAFQQQSSENSLIKKVHFKLIETTLTNQIENRKKSMKRFTQSQILNFIDCILSALMGLHFKNLNHRDIRPQKIFVCKKENETIYLLGLPLLLNRSIMQEEFLTKGQTDWYLAPQIYENKSNSIAVGLQKNDIFSLGIIALQMTSFVNPAQFYSSDFVESERIAKQIYLCKGSYSRQFCQLLQKMLERQPKNRISFNETFHSLEQLLSQNKIMTQQYSNNIFTIENENICTANFSSLQCQSLWEQFIQQK